MADVWVKRLANRGPASPKPVVMSAKSLHGIRVRVPLVIILSD